MIEGQLSGTNTLNTQIRETGPRGYSAYEVYVKNGGTLSEEEWLSSLKGDKGDKGDAGSIKFIIANELPSEDIEEDAIYMIPTGSGEDLGNTYQEYIYVNGAWESLGSASVNVDMADYPTKEETEVMINASSEIGFYTWSYSSFPKSRNNDLKSSFGTFFQNMINDAYSKGYKGIMVQKLGTSEGFNSDKPQIAFVDFTYDLQNQPKTFGFSGYAMSNGGVDMSSSIYKARIRITGTWENDVFTLSSVYWDGGIIDILHKTNTVSYTPTSNYHPATKKYVDDKTVTLTQAEYDALTTKNENTYYFIVEE